MSAVVAPVPASVVLPSIEAGADTARRFAGVGRLYGFDALQRFRQAHVCIVGVGGVGSWVAEALARSAIGALTLIDLDHLAESNINRQIHALSDTLGMAKVTALTNRIAQINPDCIVHQVEDFVIADNVAEMIPVGRFDYVVDAIDNVRAKSALIAHCRAEKIPLITLGSAGGQTDPTQIRICDLGRTEQEPLLAKVRKRLRHDYGFERGERRTYHIDAVYSTERLRLPFAALAAGEIESDDAAQCAVDSDSASQSTAGVGAGINCAGYGSGVVVTATFGLVAASHVLRKLAGLV